jgi:hypothetical protein
MLKAWIVEQVEAVIARKRHENTFPRQYTDTAEPSTSAEVKKVWIYTSVPPYTFMA